MLRFKPFTPYILNQNIFAELKLKPNTRSREVEFANKDTMSVLDILNIISDNFSEFIFDKDEIQFLSLDFQVGKDQYSFDATEGSGTHILRVILGIMKETGVWEDAFYSTWYYFEDDRLIEDLHLYYRFFLCRGDRIVSPVVIISDGPPFSFPENFLLEDTEVTLNNDAEDRVAITRICYEKWQNETLPGKIFAMKTRMQQESDLAERFGDKSYLTFENVLPLLIRESSLLKEKLTHIMWLLFVLVSILIYMALFSLFK